MLMLKEYDIQQVAGGTLTAPEPVNRIDPRTFTNAPWELGLGKDKAPQIPFLPRRIVE